MIDETAKLIITGLGEVMQKYNLHKIEYDGIYVEAFPPLPTPVEVPKELRDAMNMQLSDDDMLENPFKGIPGFEEKTN